jgi:hypothetical protein
MFEDSIERKCTDFPHTIREIGCVKTIFIPKIWGIWVAGFIAFRDESGYEK